MKLRKKSIETDEQVESLRRRVSRLSTHDLLNWADQAGSGMAKAFNDYRHLGEKASLDEIDMGIKALFVVAEDLRIRAEAENGKL